ncbi:radical SAM protein [Methanoculleus sp.]|uniref:radical SAM/SPASM domain-containing protein n=1 Tax=Methanoculleus sp. TaxID=90427 RepID=UPI0025D73A56|nr:radical SAM protein [Methanoculleus sp.]MCK9320190.1 radical SAM protein [Methanoculleus sp.]
MSNQKYIISKYTIITEIEYGFLIYNMLNGLLTHIYDKELMKQVKIMQEGEFLEGALDKRLIRAFCKKVNADEKAVAISNNIKSLWNSRRIGFIIIPNYKCNFKCIYCYEEHNNKEMSSDIVFNLINAIKKYIDMHDLKQLRIEWFGGEPLLSINIINNVSNEINEYINDKAINAEFGMTTNGYLLNDEYVDTLYKKSFKFFQITVDGGERSHNMARPLKNGDPTWHVILSNLERMSKRKNWDFKVTIRINYNYDTLENIDQLFDFISKKLDNRFNVYFRPVGKWGGKNDNNLDIVQEEHLNIINDLLIKQASGKIISVDRHYDDYNPMGMICYAADPYNYTLDYNGDIRKCTDKIEDKNDFNIIGTYKRGEFEINNTKLSDFIIPNWMRGKDTKCIECKFLPVCFGQLCPFSRIKFNKVRCVGNTDITLAAVLRARLLYYNSR